LINVEEWDKMGIEIVIRKLREENDKIFIKSLMERYDLNRALEKKSIEDDPNIYIIPSISSPRTTYTKKPNNKNEITGEIAPSYDVRGVYKSYWYSFITSLDRPRDIIMIKELLLWGSIYHKYDSIVKILIPNNSGEDYRIYSNLFKITKVPCLVLTDKADNADEYIKFSSGLLTQQLLGEDYIKLREIMDYLHNVLFQERELKKVNKQVWKSNITNILVKSWSEIKDFVTINISS
jgi:hypothetical protein